MKSDTHKMSAGEDAPYAVLGTLLAELRQKAGIAQQSQLAELVKTSQQTVSRWEAGLTAARRSEFHCLPACCEPNPKNSSSLPDMHLRRRWFPSTSHSLSTALALKASSGFPNLLWNTFIPMQQSTPLADRATRRKARISTSRFPTELATPSNASGWFSLARAMLIKP